MQVFSAQHDERLRHHILERVGALPGLLFEAANACLPPVHPRSGATPILLYAISRGSSILRALHEAVACALQDLEIRYLRKSASSRIWSREWLANAWKCLGAAT